VAGSGVQSGADFALAMAVAGAISASDAAQSVGTSKGAKERRRPFMSSSVRHLSSVQQATDMIVVR
jgi:hypothetical protein